MREIPFEKENLQIFENETEIYKGDFEKKMACLTAMEMMNDCLDYIYQLLHPMYPKVYKPRIYLADKNEPNAFAQPTGEADGYIVVFSGLIFSFLNLIEEKYTEDVLKKYKIFEGIPQEEVLSGIRVYFWRYFLYGIWLLLRNYGRCKNVRSVLLWTGIRSSGWIAISLFAHHCYYRH